MEKETVIVTGIGGNVGQGILAQHPPPLPAAAARGHQHRGLFRPETTCVMRYTEVPYAYHEGISPPWPKSWPASMPNSLFATDYEVYHLALFCHSLPPRCGIRRGIHRRVLDNILTYTEFSKYGIPFAASCLPAHYQGQYARLIAKPARAEDRGALFWTLRTLPFFRTSTCCRNSVEGPEITTAFYVTRQGELSAILRRNAPWRTVRPRFAG